MVFALFAGCSSTPKAIEPVVFTEEALAATAPAKGEALAEGSSAEREAIERFKKSNSDFSKANITGNTKNVYDPEVYFRDPFKQIHGEAPFEAVSSARGWSDFILDGLAGCERT